MSGESTMRRRAIIGVGMLLVGTVASGCSTGGGGGEAAACEVLLEAMDTPSFQADGETPDQPPSSASGDVLEWTLKSIDQRQVPVIIYIDPIADDEDLADLASEAEAQDGVVRVRQVDRAETYKDFQRLFEGQARMLDNVLPEDLPMSVQVEAELDAVEELTEWARSRPNTFEVRRPPTAALAGDYVTKQGDRDEWEALADRLATVEGDPDWARTSADVIGHFLEQGVDAPYPDPEALTEARIELQQLTADCRPD